MSGTFSVKNFEKFQHYKDRSPPWIRLYNSLLDDYEFGRLQDASKAHLLAIWLLASRYENRIPFDAEWIGRHINATEPIDLAVLAASGFILLDEACSKMLAERQHVASKVLSQSREEKSRAETESSSLRSDVPPRTSGKLKPKATRIPGDFQPDLDEAERLGLSRRAAEQEAASFADYWRAKPTNATKLDWPATWRNWVRKSVKDQNKGDSHGQRRPQPGAQESPTRVAARIARGG